MPGFADSRAYMRPKTFLYEYHTVRIDLPAGTY
jgi:hypothetical protein